MIPVLQRESTRSLKTKPLTGSVSLLTQHSPKVIESQERYSSPSRLANLSRWILTNGLMRSSSHGQFCPTAKPQNGVCANSRVALDDFGYRWGQKTWINGRTSSRHVFGSTTCGRDLLASIKSRMSTSQFGVKDQVKGCGRGLRISCLLISGGMIALAGSMFRRNGIEALVHLQV